jgi:hypothetical protein
MTLVGTRRQSQVWRPRRRSPRERQEAQEPDGKVRHAQKDQTAGPRVKALGHPKVEQGPSKGEAHRERQTPSAEQMDGGNHSRRRSQAASNQTETLVATESKTEADTYTIQKKEERSYIQEVERH